MYESPYPDAEDLVIVQVKRVAEMGAYVSLMEYADIEGKLFNHRGVVYCDRTTRFCAHVNHGQTQTLHTLPIFCRYDSSF